MLKDASPKSEFNITILPDRKCTTDRCRVYKGSILKVDQKFVANRNTEVLNIYTESLGGDYSSTPYIHIMDGKNACENLYTLDEQKVSCPVKKGVEYISRNLYYISPRHSNVSSQNKTNNYKKIFYFFKT